VFEVNIVYDAPDSSLRRSMRVLRVRTAGKLGTLTYKGPPTTKKYKSREELEIPISTPALMGVILERLGFKAVFRYEKRRTEFQQPGSRGIAMLDETPVGTYIELEGSEAWIDRTTRRMGFAEKDYICASYARLYLDWAAREGVPPSNMVFGDASKST
jgi:adenylate cyclase class 2